MQTSKTTWPTESVLTSAKRQFDYADSYEGIYTDKDNNITSAKIGKTFFSSAPAWVEKAFSLRNNAVRFFGLKASENTSNRAGLLRNFRCEPGEKLGLFTVFNRTENEVILGEDDVHLNFRVSLLKRSADDQNQKKLIITTAVQFNNLLGRLYFLPVKPAHKIIVPAMLKAIIRELEL